MTGAVELAKSAMDALQRAREQKGAPRRAAADEVRNLAQITEATRIALHRVATIAERPGATDRRQIEKAVADLETTGEMWLNAWADVRFDLDRYLDASIVEVLRALRHEARSHVTDVTYESTLLLRPRRSSTEPESPAAGPKGLSSSINRALEALDRVTASLGTAHDIIERGGVGSTGR